MRPKILIGKSDTLVSIAEDIFGDPQLAWLILDINVDSLTVLVMDQRYIVRLRSRQELFLPVRDDILTFSFPALSAAGNLITVVDENQIDRQLLEQAFDPLLGGAANSGDELAVKQFGDLTIVDED